MPFAAASRLALLRLRDWARHHGGEILWAVIFAAAVGIPLAYYAALYFTEPKHYKIYVIAGSKYLTKSDDKNRDTKHQFETALPALKLSKLVDVDVEVEEVADDASEDVQAEKAEELVRKGDALLVIGHLDSGPTEASLSRYFEARPQVPFIATVQTDDDLRTKACSKHNCYDGSKPLPYLQLSPTNMEQARWAVRFALENYRHNFLIVESDGTVNGEYSRNLASDYARAISEFNDSSPGVRSADDEPPNQNELLTANLVHTEVLTDEILWKWIGKNHVDCLFYVGDFDGAPPLLTEIAGLERDHKQKLPLMVILDDSVVDRRFPTTEFKLSPVNITDQADAQDYKDGRSVYALDAIAIAGQLIDDLNQRGFDWMFRMKALLRVQTVEDARRNLVRVMQENFAYRRAYFGSELTGVGPDSPNLYAFKEYKRVGGMFHVWERKGYRSEDVDPWHPKKVIPRSPASPNRTNERTGLTVPRSGPG